MALQPAGEAGLQDKASYLPEAFQSGPQHLAAYYTPYPPYGPYGNTWVAAEQDFQLPPFAQLAATVSASQAVTQFAFGTAPRLLSPGLALPREPFYDLPWHGQLPQWYPLPHFPREPQHFLSGNRDNAGATGEDLAHTSGRSDSGQGYGSEISNPPPPVDTSPLPERLTTSRSLPDVPSKRPEDGPKPQNREGESAERYHFTQKDLQLVLYGVFPSLEHPGRLYYAASGLQVHTGSSGSDSLPQTLDQVSLQLPEGLCLRQMLLGEVLHFGVFCCNLIAKGVRFGPFQGKVVNASEVKAYGDNSVMWEIFEDGCLSHFIDGKSGAGNWMSYVNCARFSKEQNLVAVQHQGQIFYESCKEIYPNQELLVWYGDCYEKFLDIPVSLLVTEQGKQESEESAEGYRCEQCEKVFTYRYYRDKHLKYTPCVDKGDRKFPCSLCKRSFEKRDRLRVHVLHVHEKHRPHKCSTCGKCFSQSSSLNKHKRVHSGERPYQCVYCTKKFTASSILRTHIRQHSGEKPFKCKHCGKPFASHAAHDSHVRRSHKDKGCSCSTCGQAFSHTKALYSHMKLHANR